jgi:hypothetical protein
MAGEYITYEGENAEDQSDAPIGHYHFIQCAFYPLDSGDPEAETKDPCIKCDKSYHCQYVNPHVSVITYSGDDGSDGSDGNGSSGSARPEADK